MSSMTVLNVICWAERGLFLETVLGTHSPSILPDSGYLSCAQPPSDVTCTSGFYCTHSQITANIEFLPTFIIISHAMLFMKILRNFCFSKTRWLCLFYWYSILWNLCDRMRTPGKVATRSVDKCQQISKTLRHGFLNSPHSWKALHVPETLSSLNTFPFFI